MTIACGPESETANDPIASLSSAELSAAFTAEYWDTQAREGTAVWGEAVAFCREDTHQLRPNCGTVQQVHFVLILQQSAGRRSRSYDGEGGVPWPPAMEEILAAEPRTTESAPED